MKSGKLLDAIGMVGDDLIDEARAPQKKVIQWKHWTAIAACLALLITVLSIIKPFQPGQPDIIGPDSLHSNPITIPFTSPRICFLTSSLIAPGALPYSPIR